MYIRVQPREKTGNVPSPLKHNSTKVQGIISTTPTKKRDKGKFYCQNKLLFNWRVFGVARRQLVKRDRRQILREVLVERRFATHTPRKEGARPKLRRQQIPNYFSKQPTPGVDRLDPRRGPYVEPSQWGCRGTDHSPTSSHPQPPAARAQVQTQSPFHAPSMRIDMYGGGRSFAADSTIIFK